MLRRHDLMLIPLQRRLDPAQFLRDKDNVQVG